MGKAIADTLIYVMRPDAAYMTVTGLVDIWLTDQPHDYKGKVVVQSGIYADETDEFNGIANMKAIAKGTDMEAIDPFEFAPEMTLLGWVTAGSFKMYATEADFEKDRDRHGIDGTLAVTKAYYGAKTLYGWEVSNANCLMRPVLEFPGPEAYGQFYRPENPLQETAIKRIFAGHHGTIVVDEL